MVQAGLEFTEMLVSAFQVLGLKLCHHAQTFLTFFFVIGGERGKSKLIYLVLLPDFSPLLSDIQALTAWAQHLGIAGARDPLILFKNTMTG